MGYCWAPKDVCSNPLTYNVHQHCAATWSRKDWEDWMAKISKALKMHSPFSKWGSLLGPLFQTCPHTNQSPKNPTRTIQVGTYVPTNFPVQVGTEDGGTVKAPGGARPSHALSMPSSLRHRRAHATCPSALTRAFRCGIPPRLQKPLDDAISQSGDVTELVDPRHPRHSGRASNTFSLAAKGASTCPALLGQASTAARHPRFSRIPKLWSPVSTGTIEEPGVSPRRRDCTL